MQYTTAGPGLIMPNCGTNFAKAKKPLLELIISKLSPKLIII